MDGIFELVKSGEKKFEVRINRGKFADIKAGDCIEFHNSAGDTVRKVIGNISQARSIEEVLERYAVTDILPGYT